MSGCASAEPADALPDVAATASAPTVTPASPNVVVTDIETCEAFTDVSTILHNAMVGVYEGRMTQQEYDGWMRLATRVLDRVPTRGEGAVSEAVEALKAASPAVPPGGSGATNIDTPEAGTPSPADACRAAGYELFAEGFTGG
jgi:hypothetical protein